eukprot:3573917-Pleurochrysis_carterae.AAC.1
MDGNTNKLPRFPRVPKTSGDALKNAMKLHVSSVIIHGIPDSVHLFACAPNLAGDSNLNCECLYRAIKADYKAKGHTSMLITRKKPSNICMHKLTISCFLMLLGVVRNVGRQRGEQQKSLGHRICGVDSRERVVGDTSTVLAPLRSWRYELLRVSAVRASRLRIRDRMN